jgi:hypothetical protein
MTSSLLLSVQMLTNYQPSGRPILAGQRPRPLN